MGLIMLGSGSPRCVDEMLQYARETQHEKIIRGLAMGVAFIYYGRQEEADGVVEKLLGDKVPDIRTANRACVNGFWGIGFDSALWGRVYACTCVCWDGG